MAIPMLNQLREDFITESCKRDDEEREREVMEKREGERGDEEREGSNGEKRG